MKILIVCSTNFYNKIDGIIPKLTANGHTITTPNCYNEPDQDINYDDMTDAEYTDFLKRMYYSSKEKISNVDAILVLNYTKEKNDQLLENYIGASTFLEMYEAFMQNKKIYMVNGYPNNMLYDEIKGFNPIIINENFNMIK